MSGHIVKAPSLMNQVYGYLKNVINSNKLEVGKIYSEQWLADELGVSRTPVREAILQLKKENLLEVVPYKGFWVRPITSKEIQEIFEIRQAIEGFCVVTIAKSDSATQLFKRIEENLKLQEEFLKLGDINQFTEIDEQFHQSLIDFVNNSRLCDLYNDIRTRVERFIVNTLIHQKKRMDAAIEEHYDIYDKMRSGSSWPAHEAMVQHLVNAQELIMRFSMNAVKHK